MSSTRPGSAAALTAVENGAQLVICVGGHGTVRACAEALAGTSVPLAIVPAGSANLTARALRVPAGLDAPCNLPPGPCSLFIAVFLLAGRVPLR